MTEELSFEVVTEELNITFNVDQIGPQGPKPKKGTDYWTEADRAEISTEIDQKTQTAAAPALQAAGNAVTIAEGARAKADEAKSQVQGHENDVGIHVTPREKDTWDSKAQGDHTHDGRYYTKAQTDAAIAAEKAERMAADAATGRALEEETTARQNAFAESERQLQAEREARAAADTELQTAIDGKQPTLTAGEHITISGNVISAEVPEAPVTDVTINGTSIVDGGVAKVPIAGTNRLGTTKFTAYGNGGISVDEGGETSIYSAVQENIDNRQQAWSHRKNNPYDTRPIVPSNLDYAVKAAMTDGKGAAWTDAEKAAARARMGLGNFELIADVTLSEDTGSISFDKFADGTQLKAMAVRVCLIVPPSASNAVFSGFYGNNGALYARNSFIVGNANNEQIINFVLSSFGGQVSGYRSSLNKASESDSIFSVATGFIGASKQVINNGHISDCGWFERIEFIRKSADSIPVGTRIIAYGVRA